VIFQVARDDYRFTVMFRNANRVRLIFTPARWPV
jgi:hypothetical protein